MPDHGVSKRVTEMAPTFEFGVLLECVSTQALAVGLQKQSPTRLCPLGGIDQLTEPHSPGCGETRVSGNMFHHSGQTAN